MAQYTRTQFEALYGTSGTQFPDNTTGQITELIMRTFGKNLSDSFLNSTSDLQLLTVATGTDTYVLTGAITAYTTGFAVFVQFTNANTGAATINVNSLGAKAIRKNGATALASGDIAAGQAYLLVYDGTNFQILGKIASAAVAPAWGSITGTVTDQTDLVTYVSAQIASGVAGLMDYRGVFDASVNAYPSSGGSGTAGAILKSDFWIVSVGGTLPTGLVVAPGDLVIAKQDAPGNTEANWSLVEYNIGFTPAPLASPAFTGTPVAPTASDGNDSTQIATTEFVKNVTVGSDLYLYTIAF